MTLPVYMVFDVLELDRRDLRDQVLRERRRLLERLVSSHGMVMIKPFGIDVLRETVSRLLGGS